MDIGQAAPYLSNERRNPGRERQGRTRPIGVPCAPGRCAGSAVQTPTGGAGKGCGADHLRAHPAGEREMIRITPSIAIAESEIEERFIRASGPGGQNVNKPASAVQLRFDAAHSPSLPDEVRARLVRLAGKRVNAAGVLVIEAKRYRTQARNRADALDRLTKLILRASERPRPRRKTKPGPASKERRLEAKHQRTRIKRTRAPVSDSED